MTQHYPYFVGGPGHGKRAPLPEGSPVYVLALPSPIALYEPDVAPTAMVEHRTHTYTYRKLMAEGHPVRVLVSSELTDAEASDRLLALSVLKTIELQGKELG